MPDAVPEQDPVRIVLTPNNASWFAGSLVSTSRRSNWNRRTIPRVVGRSGFSGASQRRPAFPVRLG